MCQCVCDSLLQEPWIIMSHVGKHKAERSRHLSLPVSPEEEPLPRRSKNSSDFIKLGKHVCIFQQGQRRESECWTSLSFFYVRMALHVKELEGMRM